MWFIDSVSKRILADFCTLFCIQPNLKTEREREKNNKLMWKLMKIQETSPKLYNTLFFFFFFFKALQNELNPEVLIWKPRVTEQHRVLFRQQNISGDK